MKRLTLLQQTGLLTTALLTLGAWFSAYFTNPKFFTWLTLLVVLFIIWTLGAELKKNFKDTLISSFIFGALVVLFARLLLAIGTRHVFGVWTLASNSNYEVTGGLSEIFRMLINGTALQSLSLMLLGGAVAMITIVGGRVVAKGLVR